MDAGLQDLTLRHMRVAAADLATLGVMHHLSRYFQYDVTICWYMKPYTFVI